MYVLSSVGNINEYLPAPSSLPQLRKSIELAENSLLTSRPPFPGSEVAQSHSTTFQIVETLRDCGFTHELGPFARLHSKILIISTVRFRLDSIVLIYLSCATRSLPPHKASVRLPVRNPVAYRWGNDKYKVIGTKGRRRSTRKRRMDSMRRMVNEWWRLSLSLSLSYSIMIENWAHTRRSRFYWIDMYME